MANHKSSIKRIRQTEKRRLRNKYYAKTARNAVRDLRAYVLGSKDKDKEVAVGMYREVTKKLDKLAAKNIIHKNKAGNLKSKLAKMINKI